MLTLMPRRMGQNMCIKNYKTRERTLRIIREIQIPVYESGEAEMIAVCRNRKRFPLKEDM